MKLTFFLIYLLSLLGAVFEAAVAYNEKHTSMKPLSATRMPVFLCDILPAAVCSSFFFLLLKLFFLPRLVLFCAVVSIHTRGLREFNKIPLRICS